MYKIKLKREPYNQLIPFFSEGVYRSYTAKQIFWGCFYYTNPEVYEGTELFQIGEECIDEFVVFPSSYFDGWEEEIEDIIIWKQSPATKWVIVETIPDTFLYDYYYDPACYDFDPVWGFDKNRPALEMAKKVVILEKTEYLLFQRDDFIRRIAKIC